MVIVLHRCNLMHGLRASTGRRKPMATIDDATQAAQAVAATIEAYMAGQSEPKRSDMKALHRVILDTLPGCRLWFLDGKNDEGKTVSNPNIGYGFYTIKYADGKTRDFYRIGMSPNT